MQARPASAAQPKGMEGIPVSGQDGDHAALSRVAIGTQTVSAWKDARSLGKAAAEIAVALASETAMADVANSQSWTSPSGTTMSAMFFAPVPVTNDNLTDVIDAGWIGKDALYAGSELEVCN